MIPLNCVIIGVGSPFTVEIDESASFYELKERIKKMNEIRCRNVDAKTLQLFLAKKDKVWLESVDAVALSLGEGGTLQGC
ncbi:Crinkler (CRN) [Phytophthora megakarya]|uniref:Crinkler (CRN) n=1 Tax=Phytophthora megakarya TaxID=4795 RepID=A0A225WMZ4_9STRA|nr:Crinkler (CRN) [Phytophthora megakarya]